MNPENTDICLSEEDLDLRHLCDEELGAVCEAWLIAAAATDDEDRHTSSHGVFLAVPGYGHLVPECSSLAALPFSS